MKRPLNIAWIFVVLAAVILLSIPDKSAPITESETVNGRTFGEEPQLEPVDASTVSATAGSGSLPQVTMKTTEYIIDPIGINHERENPRFEFRGGAGTGRVVDRQGKLLLESGEAIAIFGAAVGPDKEKVLVKGGNAINFVLEPSSGRKIELPELPPGVNMLGFGDWRWIGRNLLFGISGVTKIFHDGAHQNCCSENNVAQTRFYTFDLLTQQLSELVMPSAVTQPGVNAVDVMSDGHIHLRFEEPLGGVEQDLCWFKIDASK